jgi:hypothetical protein
MQQGNEGLKSGAANGVILNTSGFDSTRAICEAGV